jgi:hypothetical protein
MLLAIYEKLANVWRADMMDKMWILYFASFIYSFLFVYIFSKGYKGRGFIEGVRYGVVIGFFSSVVGSLYQYVLYPIPSYLAAHWMVYGMIQMIFAGVLAALVYRPKKQA